MLTKEFDYNLPKELIAQTPAEPRDSSRLMVVNRGNKSVEHRQFFNIVDYLKKGDLVVWNNTKVFKARLKGIPVLDEQSDGINKKIETTGRILNASPVEVFLVKPMENKRVWKVLAKPGRKLRLGMKLMFAEDFSAEVMLKEEDGTFLIQFEEDDLAVRAKANKYGEVPTPPYIKLASSVIPSEARADEESLSNKQKDRDPSNTFGMTNELSERYQTIYAKEEGSVAAPTAGFHFTPELIEKLKEKGVEFAEVTLHVGLGTFLPVKTERVEDHRMLSEWVELTAKNADLINQAKADGRRVVAVGTTTVRVLEGVVCHFDRLPFVIPTTHSLRSVQAPEESLSQSTNGQRSLVGASLARDENRLRPYTGDINIFITPGFKFQIVDALITNFHLPKSTLLMLVCAFASDSHPEFISGSKRKIPKQVWNDSIDGRKFVLECYQKAVEEKYRFYSFGDAMFIK